MKQYRICLVASSDWRFVVSGTLVFIFASLDRSTFLLCRTALCFCSESALCWQQRVLTVAWGSLQRTRSRVGGRGNPKLQPEWPRVPAGGLGREGLPELVSGPSLILRFCCVVRPVITLHHCDQYFILKHFILA